MVSQCLKRKIKIASASAVASCMLLAETASATGIPVVDGVHLGLTTNGWISQYAQKYSEYAKQVEQLTTQINQLETQLKQYRQMYVKGIAYKPKPSHREDVGARFPVRQLDEGVEQRCGTGPGKTVVGARQYGVCVALVQTQNRQFNAMREFLMDVRENDQQLELARQERAGIAATDQGALQANTNKMASIQSKMENDLQNARYTMDAYSSVLASLNDNLVRLANEALSNKGTRRSVIQGAALKLALQAARSRQR